MCDRRRAACLRRERGQRCRSDSWPTLAPGDCYFETGGRLAPLFLRNVSAPSPGELSPLFADARAAGTTVVRLQLTQGFGYDTLGITSAGGVLAPFATAWDAAIRTPRRAGSPSFRCSPSGATGTTGHRPWGGRISTRTRSARERAGRPPRRRTCSSKAPRRSDGGWAGCRRWWRGGARGPISWPGRPSRSSISRPVPTRRMPPRSRVRRATWSARPIAGPTRVRVDL